MDSGLRFRGVLSLVQVALVWDWTGLPQAWKSIEDHHYLGTVRA